MEITTKSVPEEGYVNRPKEEYLSDLLFNFKNDIKRLTNVRKLDGTLKNLSIHE